MSNRRPWENIIYNRRWWRTRLKVRYELKGGFSSTNEKIESCFSLKEGGGCKIGQKILSNFCVFPSPPLPVGSYLPVFSISIYDCLLLCDSTTRNGFFIPWYHPWEFYPGAVLFFLFILVDQKKFFFLFILIFYAERQSLRSSETICAWLRTLLYVVIYTWKHVSL